ncbi:hypothetical protein Ocin01_13161 [Orchesella cincta]|uniref:TERF2-interacting telomeric protein 1 Myb domain-containing protein n=1 Tax=Orchesella cincta TaxID=48709 RepID=A0A1D2MKY1_ORCCI|nr:hypothetical protein Ocin01_13161 [Orchesella cincta]
MASTPGNSSSNQNQNDSGQVDGFRYIGPEAHNTFLYLQKSKRGKKKDDQWSPSIFQLIPPEDNYSNLAKSDLYKNIRRAGGSNYPGRELDRDIPGVMRILNEDYFVENEEEDMVIPLDTYSSAFIYRCIANKNKGLPLPHPWKYLIPHATSKYGSKYDARKILTEEMDWDDIDPLVFPPNHERITARQWIEELRRIKAELDKEEAEAIGDGSQDEHSPGDQNGTASTTNTSDDVEDADKEGEESSRNNQPVASTSRGTSHSSRKWHSCRKRLKVLSESESDGDDMFEAVYVAKRKGIRIAAVRQNSTRNAQDSPRSEKVDPAAVYSKLNRKKIAHEKATTCAELTSPMQFRNGNDETAAAPVPAGEDESAQRSNKTPAQTPPSKSTPTPSRENGESPLRPAATSSSASASKPPAPLPTNRVVAVAGPDRNRNNRHVPKRQPSPAGDNGWVNCDRSSSDESVHFSENEDGDGDEEVDVKPRLAPLWTRYYTIEEGQRLLDLIIKHEAYRYVNGNKFWQLVQKSNKFNGRTFQSMRNHFLKTVLYKLCSAKTKSVYKISPEDLKKLKKGVYSQDQKHSKICPDYKI